MLIHGCDRDRGRVLFPPLLHRHGHGHARVHVHEFLRLRLQSFPSLVGLYRFHLPWRIPYLAGLSFTSKILHLHHIRDSESPHCYMFKLSMLLLHLLVVTSLSPMMFVFFHLPDTDEVICESHNAYSSKKYDSIWNIHRPCIMLS